MQSWGPVNYLAPLLCCEHSTCDLWGLKDLNGKRYVDKPSKLLEELLLICSSFAARSNGEKALANCTTSLVDECTLFVNEVVCIGPYCIKSFGSRLTK